MNIPLDVILQQPHPWFYRETNRRTEPGHIATGFAAFDRLLPGGGWPLGGLTELYHAQPGIGELRLLMPALARLSRQGRWIAFIAPPYVLHAPALASFGIDLSHVLLVHPKNPTDALNTVEQGLRSGTCGAVIAWPKQIDGLALQRLQQAAEAGNSWGVLFRDPACQDLPSPASLRLQLEIDSGSISVRLGGSRTISPELMLDLSRQADLTPASTPMHEPYTAASWPAPRPALPLRRRQPARRPEQPQLDLPLPPMPGAPLPRRQDQPGILSWRWRK